MKTGTFILFVYLEDSSPKQKTQPAISPSGTMVKTLVTKKCGDEKCRDEKKIIFLQELLKSDRSA